MDKAKLFKASLDSHFVFSTKQSPSVDEKNEEARSCTCLGNEKLVVSMVSIRPNVTPEVGTC